MNSKIVITIIAQPLRVPPTRQGEATAREAAAPLTLCLIGGNSLPLKAAPDGSNLADQYQKGGTYLLEINIGDTMANSNIILHNNNQNAP